MITFIYLQNPNNPSILLEWIRRRVALVEDFYHIITEVHCKEKGHVGTKKTLAEVFATIESQSNIKVFYLN